jgi:hypothetical protein
MTSINPHLFQSFPSCRDEEEAMASLFYEDLLELFLSKKSTWNNASMLTEL